MALHQIDLMRVGVVLILLPLFSALNLRVSQRHRMQLEFQRNVPHRISAGEETKITLELRNTSSRSWSIMCGQDQLPHQLGRRPRFVLPGLAPQHQRRVGYTITPSTRGRYQLGPLTLSASDPFGLAETHLATPGRTELIVHPRVFPLTLAGSSGSSTGGTGTTPVGAEDYDIRYYQPGDDLRRVHWRTSARRGSLMVRQPESEAPRRLVVLLDSRLELNGPFAAAHQLDAVVELAASVLCHFHRLGYQASLVVDGHAATPGTPLVELLDRLSALGYDGQAYHQPPATARLNTDPVVAVLAQLTTRQAQLLLHQGSSGSTRLALVAAGSAGGSAEPAGAAALRAGGWQVRCATPGQTPTQLWTQPIPIGGLAGNIGRIT